MTTFNRGDVVLASVVFTDGTSTKKRPAIVISGPSYHREREEIIVAAVSSNTKRALYGDIVLQEWRKAGLLFPSTVTGILFTMKKTLVEKRLGTLSQDDLAAVEKNLARIMGLGAQDAPGKVAEAPKPFKAAPRKTARPPRQKTV